MTDLEMIKKCAEKMGYEFSDATGTICVSKAGVGNYNPLHDDAQAMALLKKFHLLLYCDKVNTSAFDEEYLWGVVSEDMSFGTENFDLNRAIVECVAKLP